MLRWLDSLDLSFTVRNPRIDLANGFIIAEIISRYFPKKVNIYSFYNNQAKDKRINNWEQIQKGKIYSLYLFESVFNGFKKIALYLFKLYFSIAKEKF